MSIRFVLFLADQDSNVPEAHAEDISALPSEPPPGGETQCLKTQTEGATAKVILLAHISLVSPAGLLVSFEINCECVTIQPPVSEWEVEEQHLLEMFPKCSLSEARSALSIAKGDMEEAVRLIIEGDVQLSPTPLNVSLGYTQKRWQRFISANHDHNALIIDGILSPQVNHGKSFSLLADQKLKESILEK